MNINWFLENFSYKNFTLFEIGTADIECTVSWRTKKILTEANFFLFEAAKFWHQYNFEKALKENLNYYECAVSDIDGEILLYPSLIQNGEPINDSSSIFKLREVYGFDPKYKIYGDPYLVNSITIETFCKNNNVSPDFIHIDVEGAELKVLKNMGKYLPKCIWTEISGFHHYDTNTTFEEFNNYLESIGYYHVYTTQDGFDSLYFLKGCNISEYYEN